MFKLRFEDHNVDTCGSKSTRSFAFEVLGGSRCEVDRMVVVKCMVRAISILLLYTIYILLEGVYRMKQCEFNNSELGLY